MVRFLAPALALGALLLSGDGSYAFITSPNSCKAPSSTALNSAPSDRREFVGVAASALAFVTANAPAAWADEQGAVDDLAMPTPEEQKAKEDAEMAERLKRKAELQKKMARPASYKSSFQAEMDKQQGMKKSKEERRNALCEELGRGC
eukprot:CAMPEP_0197439816 /NCGR_PEP_ID=MMETSP1175-20131217/6476_1 /TAXON_ID=1003142 /ORGANISM="Triceratium dubium, Strain CCMP147" /LENGTH=147 /DNA_ID=CAMNT_0042969801 /DNA_START=55 /DNA_END=498 /DNA_ORIENTATION=-